MASASNDTTAVVWDLTTPSAAERKQAAALTQEGAESLWSDLAGDAARADRAIRILGSASVRAVLLLNHKLRPIAKVDAEHVKRLIAQLDDDQFVERERAAKQLAALDELAPPALRAAESRSLEHRRRIEALLDRASLLKSPQMLQSLRAVEVLERIGTTDAQRVLATLAAGAPEARLTQEAKAGAERLARRDARAP